MPSKNTKKKAAIARKAAKTAVRAVEHKQNKNAKRKKRSKGGGGGGRSLLKGSVPHSRFSISGDMSRSIVKGVEVVDQLVSSKLARKQVIPLNPSQAQTFPRLSGFAAQFEKYRFKEIRLMYHTAAPATRSGALGIAVLTEYRPNSSVTDFMPEFGSFEFSACGTIAQSLSTPAWRPKDPEYFYVGTSATSANTGLNIADQEPLKVFQASLAILTRDAVTADDQLLAGYLAVEYVVEFINLRPTLNKFVMLGVPPNLLSTPNLWPPGITQVTGGGLTSINLPQQPLAQSGSFGIDQIKNTISGSTDTRNCFSDIVRGTQYALEFAGEVAAVIAVDEKGWELAPPALKRQSAFVTPDPLTQTITTWFNPDVCPMPPERAQLMREYKKKPKAPAVAGDFELQFIYIDPDNPLGGGVEIASRTYSGGTGAQQIDLMSEWALPFLVSGNSENTGSPMVYVQVAPTGTESRYVYIHDCNLTVRGMGV